MSKSATTEAEVRADFTQIRYAQCWEDADVLLEALDIKRGDVCLSIASAGDNSFSLLTRQPSRVVALDLNPAQLCCVHLRKAAYASLTHKELLQLIGARSCQHRLELYQRCRTHMPPEVQAFWDSRPKLIAAGIGSIGKFERYFKLFRTVVLPLVHSRARVDQLLAGGNRARREAFYSAEWDTWRWRLMFKAFFSRFIMGRFGRDPAFFQYVQGSVADRIAERARHALVELNPAENPYLHWIVTGTYGDALPHALRAEHFETIRNNLDQLEIHCSTIEQYLQQFPDRRLDRFNLSDIFEYMSVERYTSLLTALLRNANRGARLVYWNMLVPRSRPAELADQLRSLEDVGDALLKQDKAFFYRRLIVEAVA